MATEYTKPLPRPLSPELTRPFWEAAKRHELRMPRCTTCDHVFFYPRSECPRCLSTNLEWVQVSGRARLHSFTVVQQPANAAFRDDVPYVYAVVQLDEGPRLRSDLPRVAVSSRLCWTHIRRTPLDPTAGRLRHPP